MTNRLDLRPGVWLAVPARAVTHDDRRGKDYYNRAEVGVAAVEPYDEVAFTGADFVVFAALEANLTKHGLELRRCRAACTWSFVHKSGVRTHTVIKRYSKPSEAKADREAFLLEVRKLLTDAAPQLTEVLAVFEGVEAAKVEAAKLEAAFKTMEGDVREALGLRAREEVRYGERLSALDKELESAANLIFSDVLTSVLEGYEVEPAKAAEFRARMQERKMASLLGLSARHRR